MQKHNFLPIPNSLFSKKCGISNLRECLKEFTSRSVIFISSVQGRNQVFGKGGELTFKPHLNIGEFPVTGSPAVMGNLWLF